MKSTAICSRLFPYLKGNVALYSSFGKEVSLQHLSLDRFALPVCIDDTTIAFRLWDKTASLRKGAFGILEPCEGDFLPMDWADVIVVPLVAFDSQCHRLGHGKGYYDRYLRQSNAFKIGVAYECQRLPAIPTEAHDVCLDMIISEDRVIKP